MNSFSKQRIEFAKSQVAPLLARIPSLVEIAVYGSVARGTARQDSDIDLLVVCQDGLLHLTRWQVNWRLWRAGWRGKVSVGVVVAKGAFKSETFRINSKDLYANKWFRGLKLIFQAPNTPRLTPGVPGRGWNILAKIFFTLRFALDRRKIYPAPHIKFSDEVFFHFGRSLVLKSHKKSRKGSPYGF